MSRDVNVFDDCNLSKDVEVYLNSEFYSYNDLNLDFDKKRYAVLFDMYARFFIKHIIESTASKHCLTCSRLSRKSLLRLLIARDKTNPSRVSLWM